jgi:hypothetical protein
LRGSTDAERAHSVAAELRSVRSSRVVECIRGAIATAVLPRRKRDLFNIHIHQFQPSGAVVDAAALAQFQEQWATYRKLIDGDCLAHREVSRIWRHVVICDFPETTDGWCDLGREAGFREARQIFVDPTDFFQLFRFEG